MKDIKVLIFCTIGQTITYRVLIRNKALDTEAEVLNTEKSEEAILKAIYWSNFFGITYDDIKSIPLIYNVEKKEKQKNKQ